MFPVRHGGRRVKQASGMSRPARIPRRNVPGSGMPNAWSDPLVILKLLLQLLGKPGTEMRNRPRLPGAFFQCSPVD